MVQQVGEKMAFVLLYTRKSHTWIDAVAAYLGDRGYAIQIVEDALYDLETTSPDVILMTDADDAVSLHHQLKNPRPLLILLSDEPGQMTRYVDTVLPTSPEHVERQLDLTLRLQADNARLKSVVDRLESEQQLLNQELGQQRRVSDQVETLKNAIIHNVSHELKTPLLQVKSAVSLMAEDVQDEKLASYATNATARLETLVKNITMLGASLEVNLGPVIVRDTLESVKRSLRRIWEHRDSEDRIRLHLESGLPPVMADKQGLVTVMQLLIDNGLKFSETEVDITAKRMGCEVLFTVQDYGIGIEPGEMDRIFHSFYQIDSSSTRPYGGMGIGLAIVKLILDNHNADIMVESQVGKGSTFSFKLPIVEV